MPVREKREYFIIAFSSSTQAMETESFCKEKGLPGRLIPTPEEISADCGLAWRTEKEDGERVLKELDKAGVKYFSAVNLIM